MMIISCPWCGPRNQIEFAYGGDASANPFIEDMSLDDEISNIYYRDNPCGVHVERWLHKFGCGEWLVIERNTLSHEITNIRR